MFAAVVINCEMEGVNNLCLQDMKDQLSSPSAAAQAEKKNRQVSECLNTQQNRAWCVIHPHSSLCKMNI